ncbi:5'-methylthioadenosine/S-adenosylhomocysteine nucleosidase-like [Aristolochia californica]|uniref:5'-methylthioadenosine/S-adenosylhomocysteine nucleosidase-like n=1 Tax=Aristolochia californica TaxID=171875 RepID=UPI0035DBEE6C
MAPEDNITVVEKTERSQKETPTSNVVFIIAMEDEALPVVNQFQLTEDTDSPFPKGVPWIRYHGIYKDPQINIMWPGKDMVLGSNNVGTVPAALVTYASIQVLKPDLIINLGTAGGLKVKGACIGDVFVISDVAFHHRRNPLPIRDQYGIGARKTFPTPNLLKQLDLKIGKLSTGDSFDMSPEDEAFVMANDATVIDMEGAAVAHVADLLSVPAIFLKAVTNIVDDSKQSVEEFLQNVPAVTAALSQVATRAVDFIKGKCLSEL